MVISEETQKNMRTSMEVMVIELVTRKGKIFLTSVQRANTGQ